MADFRPTVEKNALNARKMQLQAPNAAGKNAGMIIRLHENNWRIQVYTNDPNDPKQGAIAAKMDPTAFTLLLSLVQECINSEGEYRAYIDNTGYAFPNGKRSEKPEVLSRTVVGKDADGVIYLSIVESGRPNIKFPLLPSSWHVLRNSSGDVEEKRNTSRLFARGWVMLWTAMLQGQIAYFKEEEPKNGGNNGSGGNSGYQRRNGGGNNGYSGSSGSTTDSEDIPW